MQIVVLADIHANQLALEAVLEHLPTYDQLWCLGDTIGYGPRPNECLAFIQGLATYVLTGNHDLACVGKLSLEDFNADAAAANRWNGEQLRPELRAYLEQRPIQQVVEPGVTLAHASPRDPTWEYILDAETAAANLPHFSTMMCFVGHTHVPLLFAEHADGTHEFLIAEHDQELQLRPDSRYIINPGSVGQPRDHNPRAAYMLWDTTAARVCFRRIGYDIGATQKQIIAAGLPRNLAERLAVGE